MRNTPVLGTMAASKAAAIHLATTVLKAALGAAFIFVGTYQAAAGPLPMPLEAHLDMATQVVVGRITRIQETDSGPGERRGRATVAIKEVLKGTPAKTVSFVVEMETRVPNSDSEAMAPRETHKVGDFGVWLIDDDCVSAPYGLLPGDRTEEIRRILKAFEKRKWSERVNGLRAWAMVVRPESLANPVIIFAVKNDSDAGIFVPREFYHGFINASLTGQDGHVSCYVLGKMAQPKRLFCERLPPGKILYLHPDYSFIDLAWQQSVPPGKYSVVLSCTNTQEDGETKGMKRHSVRCTAWKGELKAPPVELVLPAEKKVRSDAP